jgi:hypothetical protein
MTNTSKPSWLSQLNSTQLTPEVIKEPASIPEPTEDEHVEPLAQYEAPPPLDVVLAIPSSTKLPFAFDAEAFGRRVYMPDAVANDDTLIEFKTAPALPTVTESNSNVVREPCNWSGLDGSFGKLGSSSSLYITSLVEVAPTDVIESGFANAMPFLPNDEALLPEPALGLEGRVELGANEWLGLLTPTESIAFDNHIQIVMAVNPLHASYLIRLKGWHSKFFKANITSPEMAEEHIRLALGRGEEPDGWDNADHRRIKQAQDLLAKGFAGKAKHEARERWKQYIAGAREAWKQSVVDRTAKLEILNIEVANKHEAFKLAKEMKFEEYMARFESGD